MLPTKVNVPIQHTNTCLTLFNSYSVTGPGNTHWLNRNGELKFLHLDIKVQVVMPVCLKSTVTNCGLPMWSAVMIVIKCGEDIWNLVSCFTITCSWEVMRNNMSQSGNDPITVWPHSIIVCSHGCTPMLYFPILSVGMVPTDSVGWT